MIKNEKIESKQKLTTARISFASPFSYDGGPTFASRITCLTELDTNWKFMKNMVRAIMFIAKDYR
jgi:hypothetical protein